MNIDKKRVSTLLISDGFFTQLKIKLPLIYIDYMYVLHFSLVWNVLHDI
jgi:hypothetical protein